MAAKLFYYLFIFLKLLTQLKFSACKPFINHFLNKLSHTTINLSNKFWVFFLQNPRSLKVTFLKGAVEAKNAKKLKKFMMVPSHGPDYFMALGGNSQCCQLWLNRWPNSLVPTFHIFYWNGPFCYPYSFLFEHLLGMNFQKVGNTVLLLESLR